MAIYSSTERFVTFLITGPTMFGIWPVLYALYRNNQMLPLWNGILTTLFSFMYHTLDSLDIELLVYRIFRSTCGRVAQDGFSLVYYDIYKSVNIFYG